MKDTKNTTHVVLNHKFLMRMTKLTEVTDWAGAYPQVKDGRFGSAAMSNGMINKAIEISKETGAKIVVVVHTDQLLMRDASWFTPLAQFAMEIGEDIEFDDRSGDSRVLVLRSVRYRSDDPTLSMEQGARNPAMVRAWCSAFLTVPHEVRKAQMAELMEMGDDQADLPWTYYGQALYSYPTVLTESDIARMLEEQE